MPLAEWASGLLPDYIQEHLELKGAKSTQEQVSAIDT
jgi:hypothetical protein